SAPGYFLALVPGVNEQPRPARAYWLDDAAVRAVVARTATQRPSLDPESADAAAGPLKPPQDSGSERERADLALLAALDAAPPDGRWADVLAARVGRWRAWVFSRRDVHATAGRVVRVRRGRWAGQATAMTNERERV